MKNLFTGRQGPRTGIILITISVAILIAGIAGFFIGRCATSGAGHDFGKNNMTKNGQEKGVMIKILTNKISLKENNLYIDPMKEIGFDIT